MFTIDLRKGAGLPPRRRPMLMALASVPFLIPLLGIAATVFCWQQNSALIRTQQDVIRENQQKIGGLKDDLAQFRKTEEQSRSFYQQLGDVDKALQVRIQTSPVFVELVGNLPEFLTIAKLNLERTEQQNKAAQKTEAADSGLVVLRKLKVTISGPATDTTDIAVKQYVQNLSQSPKLSRWIDDVKIISRSNESFDDQNYSLYEIECAMKDQT